MQHDQRSDVVDDVVGVTQRDQAFPCHARADDLVVMERHAAGTETAGLWFADVVQQRCEPQHEIG